MWADGWAWVGWVSGLAGLVLACANVVAAGDSESRGWDVVRVTPGALDLQEQTRTAPTVAGLWGAGDRQRVGDGRGYMLRQSLLDTQRSWTAIGRDAATRSRADRRPCHRSVYENVVSMLSNCCFRMLMTDCMLSRQSYDK